MLQGLRLLPLPGESRPVRQPGDPSFERPLTLTEASPGGRHQRGRLQPWREIGPRRGPFGVPVRRKQKGKVEVVASAPEKRSSAPQQGTLAFTILGLLAGLIAKAIMPGTTQAASP